MKKLSLWLWEIIFHEHIKQLGMRDAWKLCTIQKSCAFKMIGTYVTQSDKTGLIAYLKVSRNAGFKYLVCCSLPMVEAMCTNFSHVLQQFLTFQSIHCVSSQQLSFPPDGVQKLNRKVKG